MSGTPWFRFEPGGGLGVIVNEAGQEVGHVRAITGHHNGVRKCWQLEFTVDIMAEAAATSGVWPGAFLHHGGRFSYTTAPPPALTGPSE